MPSHCAICGKGPKKSANRSHSKVKTLRRQNVNLQKSNGEFKCTACLRSQSKQNQK